MWMHHNTLNSYRFEGPLGQLVWVSRADDSSKMMEAAAAEIDARDQEPRKKFSGALLSHEPPCSSETTSGSHPCVPSLPCPGLCQWPQSVFLISTQSQVTDFSNLTLLSCSFVWSRWLGLARLHLERSRDVTFSPAWPWGLGLWSQARLFSIDSQRGRSWEEAARGPQAQVDLTQPWKGSNWNRGGGLGAGVGRTEQNREEHSCAVTRIPWMLRIY